MSDDPAAALVARILADLTDRDAPLFVGLDGRSGAGKSTLAAEAADRLQRHGVVPVTVIEGDDFYTGGTAASWDGRTPAQKAGRVIDWRRQQVVLRQLRDRGEATWRPFDWESEDWDAEPVPLSTDPVGAVAGRVVVLEGAYSCRHELHDLLDLRVLLEAPGDVRLRRLRERDGAEYWADWQARWSEAEDHYFGTVMPAALFDLVLGSASSAGAPDPSGQPPT